MCVVGFLWNIKRADRVAQQQNSQNKETIGAKCSQNVRESANSLRAVRANFCRFSGGEEGKEVSAMGALCIYACGSLAAAGCTMGRVSSLRHCLSLWWCLLKVAVVVVLCASSSSS